MLFSITQTTYTIQTNQDIGGLVIDYAFVEKDCTYLLCSTQKPETKTIIKLLGQKLRPEILIGQQLTKQNKHGIECEVYRIQ